MKESELLAKLTIQEDGPEEHLVMHGDVGQIAYEDAPGLMTLDFSDENCINCEYPEDVTTALQEHREAIIQWIVDKGFKVNDRTLGYDPDEDGPFGDGSEEDD